MANAEQLGIQPIRDRLDFLILVNKGHFPQMSEKDIESIVPPGGLDRSSISYARRYIHKLVALAFISNPDNKPTVDHINQNKLDNRIQNLKWATDSEQQLNKPLRQTNCGEHHISQRKDGRYLIQLVANNINKRTTASTLEKAIQIRDTWLALKSPS